MWWGRLSHAPAGSTPSFRCCACVVGGGTACWRGRGQALYRGIGGSVAAGPASSRWKLMLAPAPGWIYGNHRNGRSKGFLSHILTGADVGYPHQLGPVHRMEVHDPKWDALATLRARMAAGNCNSADVRGPGAALPAGLGNLDRYLESDVQTTLRARQRAARLFVFIRYRLALLHHLHLQWLHAHDSCYPLEF
ncbi:hypothetical protein Vretimale_2203 [Volvox reticuliferus]|uniref:Uncharacterized protein n=1 Tax=Volvox reticuliferus TaxID=1737510 RepID=A0A8J4DBH8_9CHLO|nr:hypothetical protein Vretifemale_4502 [Volvox reticuliferus]GIL96343.1 hypothetical protein Vretimale_2203 [Volvox reticuliferus]